MHSASGKMYMPPSFLLWLIRKLAIIQISLSHGPRPKWQPKCAILGILSTIMREF